MMRVRQGRFFAAQGAFLAREPINFAAHCRNFQQTLPQPGGVALLSASFLPNP
jgi:hypothetical protein